MESANRDISPKVSDFAANRFRLTRADLGAIILLIAALIGMFWRVLFTSAMFFYRDISNYTYPTILLIREICRQGVLPYWNPYLNYGQPILANPNLLFFYPYTFLIVLLPVNIAYCSHYVVHFALAGVGTYWLARAWGQSYWAAFFAAFVFMFSGQVLSMGNFYNTVACAAWIPWALLATHHALESKRLRAWILLMLVFALQWLAAEPLTMMATYSLSLAYAFYHSGTRKRLRSWANLRLLTLYILVGCGMLLLCAVQFLPAADMLNNSHRANGLSFREATMWSLSPLSFLDILLPNLFGAVLSGPTAWLWLISDENFAYNVSNFLGFVPLFFALAGWAVGTDRRRNFLAGMAGVFLLVSMGHYTPVFSLARLLLPPLTVVRFPIKLLVHVVFLVAVLAGWGFDALRRAAPPWNVVTKRLTLPLQVFLGCTISTWGVAWLVPRLVTSPLAWLFHHLQTFHFDFTHVPDYVINVLRIQLPGLAGFCLAGLLLIVGLEQGKKWARPGVYAFAVLAMVQLVWVNFDANPIVPKSFYDYRPPVLDRFQGPPATYRFLSLQLPQTAAYDVQTYVNLDSIPAAQDLSPIAQSEFRARLQLYTGSMLYRAEGSLNLDPERSVPPFLYDVKLTVNRMLSDDVPFNCLLGRLNVKYIIRAKPADTPVTRKIADIFNGSPEPNRLYEDACFVPRTYVAGNSLFSTNSDETLDYLASPKFDALNTVILAAPQGSAPTVSGRESAGQSAIVHREPRSVTIQAQLDRPGYVLLLDRFDPNWHATLDGKPAAVLRANQIFRAVYAGAGQHTIKFEYRERRLKAGLIISIVAFSICLFLYVFNPRLAWLP